MSWRHLVKKNALKKLTMHVDSRAPDLTPEDLKQIADALKRERLNGEMLPSRKSIDHQMVRLTQQMYDHKQELATKSDRVQAELRNLKIQQELEDRQSELRFKVNRNATIFAACMLSFCIFMVWRTCALTGDKCLEVFSGV